MARGRGVPLKVAAVTGDDVLGLLEPKDRILETGGRVADYPWLVSANAYLGAEALLPALAAGADGLMIEVHPNPEEAFSDGPQSLRPEGFATLMEELRRLAAFLGREL